ncbi:4'-phosphopantetheinyl transferase family protein [Fodinibius halophilus]|uniref:4'-phosphopantetheinyl transferase superfamily protein n=1 Tax=Fodinibius halophilus TaxID=1736908 RepID=A0A6M1T8U1_9BACT|nr:4'-phosphopantetheinyl transferase superfamily protein [Fodinibius halophilus]NGP89845.1 4'-phosphopantetheinyl transferase superfamily protein [Fodinibius halophilus]
MRDISQQINEQLSLQGQFVLERLRSVTNSAVSLLSETELEEFHSFSNKTRQQEFITSRVLLKKMARKWNEEEFSVQKDKLGQPYGVGHSRRYYISIAHSKDKVFCGISPNRAVGVDLEPIAREVSARLRSRILHPEESEGLAELETIRLWTIKEAFIKLRGQGLRLNMNQVRVQSEEDAYFVEINNDKRAKICSFRSENDWLAIAHYQTKK